MTKSIEEIKEEWESRLRALPSTQRRLAYAPPLYDYVVMVGVETYRLMLTGYSIWRAIDEAMERIGWRLSPGRLRWLLYFVEWIDMHNRPRFDLWMIRMRGKTYHRRENRARFRTAEMEAYIVMPKYWSEEQFYEVTGDLERLWYEASESLWQASPISEKVRTLPRRARARYGIPREAWLPESIRYVGAEYRGNYRIDELRRMGINIRFSPSRGRWVYTALANWDIYYPAGPWEENILKTYGLPNPEENPDEYRALGGRIWGYYGVVVLWEVPV